MPEKSQQKMNRRTLLKLGSLGTATALAPTAALAKWQKNTAQTSPRALSFYNLHTGESLHTTYWEEGVYHAEALKEINHLLRDHRTGGVIDMDVELLDLLHDIRNRTGTQQAFNVISGYRSPKTNAMLNQQTSGVAKKSLHMVGKAIDINLPGFQLADLRKVALQQKRGGVGFYPKSNFIHVDTGRVRYW